MSITWRERVLVVTVEIIGITGAPELPPHKIIKRKNGK
jgi:hypothetical protein